LEQLDQQNAVNDNVTDAVSDKRLTATRGGFYLINELF